MENNNESAVNTEGDNKKKLKIKNVVKWTTTASPQELWGKKSTLCRGIKCVRMCMSVCMYVAGWCNDVCIHVTFKNTVKRFTTRAYNINDVESESVLYIFIWFSRVH